MPRTLQDKINSQLGLPIEFGASVRATNHGKGYYTRSPKATFKYKLSKKQNKE